MAGSRELRQRIKEHKDSRSSWRIKYPPELRKDILDFIDLQVRGGMHITRACALIGLNTGTLANWRNDKAKPVPPTKKKPKVKVKEYKGHVEGVKIDEIEVTFKHPYLGDISVTGDKAKEIWNKLSEI